MLHSYFRIAFRYLTRNKAATLINVSGLAIGMATALLIGLWIANEASFDHYAPNHRRIAQILLLQRLTSSAMGHHATPEHPETYISQAVAPVTGAVLAQKGYQNTFERTALVTWPGDHIVGAGDKKVSRKGVWAEPNLPRIFGFHMLEGSPETLKDPSTVLISQSLAAALFGNTGSTGHPGRTNLIGKTIRLDTREDFRVGGVYADLPSNTTFAETDLILPWTSKDLREAGIKDPIGKKFNLWQIKGTIIGVVKDFNFASLHEAVAPAAFYYEGSNWRLYVKTSGKDAAKAIAAVGEVWRQYGPDLPFEYSFLDDDFAHMYQNDQRTGALFRVFAVVAIIISCLGLFGLATYTAQIRLKEIGIRRG